jgi:hypothetical protein
MGTIKPKEMVAGKRKHGGIWYFSLSLSSTVREKTTSTILTETVASTQVCDGCDDS